MLTGLTAAPLAQEQTGDITTPLTVLVLLLVVAILVFALARMRILRIRKTVAQSADLNNMMNQAVDMGQLYVVVYDMGTLRLENLYGDLLPPDGLSEEAFKSRIHEDSKPAYLPLVQQMKAGDTDQCDMLLRWHDRRTAIPQWICLQGHTLLERDNDGRPSYIVCTMKDVTLKVNEEQKNIELASKYIGNFNTNYIAMSFYDANGKLIDLNQSMKVICGFEGMGKEFFNSLSLFDMPLVRDDFDRTCREDFHFCQHMLYPEAGLDKYVELRIKPVTNDEGDIVYYVITGRDITAERTMYLEQVRDDKELQQANAIANQYENELHYLLEQSDMYVWHSKTEENTIYFSRSLRKNDFTRTFDEYMESMFKRDRLDAFRKISTPQLRPTGSFNVVHHFHYTPVDQSPQWYDISGTPMHDSDGNITGYFGVLRKVTALMQAQEMLRKETARAENSGKLKSVFLANMTHEIRTPLNAIVGFSDLLPMVDTEEEKREFIRIIRNNCDMLLRLINDILEASNLSSQPLEIAPKDVDFALSFNDICQTLAQRVQEPGVEFIKENPYKSLTTHLDNGRMQQVITNFVTNAVKYTHQGHIKVGYRMEERINDKDGIRQGIYMYCEDTGAGIPKNKQAVVFERFVKLNDFVQGTGLGLAICKNIADRCGGNIGVYSEGEGKGSTFWIWIPCPIMKIENNN